MALDPAPETALARSQAARRERVVSAALSLAAEGGYDAVQMRDVAVRASVALGTIYRYFTSKDHLLAAACVGWVGDLEQQLARRPVRSDDAVEQLVAVVRSATAALEREPRLAEALVTAISTPDPAVSDCQRQVSDILVRVLSAPLGGMDGERRAGIVRVLAHVWFSSLVGWVSGWGEIDQVGDELEQAARLLVPR
jgi:TetR/AcrR family transcriptional regulator, cholesterol catabolism regulator